MTILNDSQRIMDIRPDNGSGKTEMIRTASSLFRLVQRQTELFPLPMARCGRVRVRAPEE